MGWEKEDMLDIVDDIIGVTAFFGIAEGSQIMVI
jgi:peroxiredoxin family protein